jgi:hypothetical protein
MSEKKRSKLRLGLLAVFLIMTVGLVVLSIIDLRPEWSIDRTDEELFEMRPTVGPYEGYTGSDSCRDCHQNQHESWVNSWHRTMTQEADLDKMMGNFNNVSVTNRLGQELFLFERDGRAWYRANHDPQLFGFTNQTRREFPIELMTGSHHMQVYWHPTGRARTLAIMPIVYLKEAERWIPRSSAFLQPPDFGKFEHELMRWNFTCLKCHTTNPDARHLPTAPAYSFDSHVAELGISCEACHGPGAQHVHFQSESAAGKTPTTADLITNPAELDHKLSSQVCGSCHSINVIKDLNTDWREHKPGKELTSVRNVLQSKRETFDQMLSTNTAIQDYSQIHDYDNQFWLDGAVRVSGREYNGFLESACHTKGTMSCISCHAVHQVKSDNRPPKEWANDQLHPDSLGDQGCVQCHDPKEFATPAHTHHSIGSTGASCYNCHMPHITYGLLKAIRSHTIKSPTVMDTVDARRPTACNLCHLDKTLAWTSKHLHDWYGHEMPGLNEEQNTVSSAVIMSTTGDAGLRALMAWHMSWPPAVAASKSDGWIQAYLTILLKDPYDAVRYIAGRSLKTFESHADLNYDFIAGKNELNQSAGEAMQMWHRAKGQAARPTVLLEEGGFLSPKLGELFQRRNDRDVYLLE